MIAGKLILLRRCELILIPIIIVFVIYVIMQKKNGHNIIIGLVLFVILSGFVSWYDCFRWQSLSPLTLEFRTSIEHVRYRTDRNKKVIPEAYTWFPIDPRIEKNDAFDQSIMNQYIKSGGTFDFQNYQYLISYGFTVEALFRLSDPNCCTCVAVHGYDCLPNEVLIYKVPFVYIFPGEDRTGTDHYTFL